MGDEIDFDTLLLEKFELISNLAAGNDSNIKTALCAHYSVLKIELFLRWGRLEDLEEAVEKGKQAVAETHEEHEDFAARLNNLGNMLGRRYERMGKLEDLEEAIQVARKAVEVTPDDHPDLAALLNNLGTKLESRYERMGKLEDLEEAIQVARKAVKVTPEDHPDLAGWLNNLGNMLESRYERMGKLEDLEEAIQMFQHAWECDNATPFIRIRASSQALRLLQVQKNFQTAYKLSVEAINLLPYVHNRSLNRQDQQYVVSHFSGLATTACSLALQTGRGAETALEVLEQGRGVIISLLMDDRSDTSKLKVAYPQLCEEYESLRLEVNKPRDLITNDNTRWPASTHRTDTIAKLEKCVQDIQLLPGFGGFHKCITAKQMQEYSTEGSIVVVNVTDLRSDAIIISSNGLKVLSLPGLGAREAEGWINQELTMTISSDRGRKNKAYLQFLSWLWHMGVKPVLRELNCHAKISAEALPRVWWIGTGLASTFPFHSSGDISAGSMESACYWVVSSYTPTIKALGYTRERAGTAVPSRCEPRRGLIVAMPKTPGASDLPGTRVESSECISAIGPSVSMQALEQPDAASVMVQLRECNIAHFACHGVSDPVDPSSSGLILQTAPTVNNEPKQDILSVREISQAHLLRAEIAYLSACSTAQNQAIELSDEMLHVVSGFQVSGFRHGIGCLWPSDDKVCVDVATSFYSELNKSGTMKYDDRAAALALHKAVVKVRESIEYRRRPLLWAQYVHFGA